MANAIYPNYGDHVQDGDIAVADRVVTAYLVDLADYTYSATHDLLADLPVAARVSSVVLANDVSAAGVLDADNATFPSVSGDDCEAVVITVSSGGSEYLAAYYDTGVPGLPVTPVGTDIPLTVDPTGLLSLVQV